MAEQSDIQSLIHPRADRMDRQNTRLDRQKAQQQPTNSLLLRLLNQQEAMFSLHQNFQKNQGGFNNHQRNFDDRLDQFNIIFPDEIRGMKKDIKELIQMVLEQHEGRLKCPEDFMDGFMRKAG